jgi:membrane-associated protease RseP (regulator of RpoE activity)
VHAALFLLTVVTTTFMGMLQYAGFISVGEPGIPRFEWGWVLHGFWYSGTILAILGCHELGHYLACRYYRIDASLPYFLPAPLLTGTVGAFIRIREPIRSKRVLFDVGVAGPIAGFVVAIPALLIGVSLSRFIAAPPDLEGYLLGKPLLYQAVVWLVWGAPPQGHSFYLHPMAFAAWFGLLATALNLFPIGQLDGGHISYAVLGRRWSTNLTLASVTAVIALTFVSVSWLVWAVLLVTMLLVFGPRHPRTEDEDMPLDRGRMLVAAFSAVMFAVCFTPAPMEMFFPQ